MSEIGIACTVCDTEFYVKDSLRGGLTNCPKCRELLQVPGQAHEDTLFWVLVIGAAVIFTGIVGMFFLFAFLA